MVAANEVNTNYPKHRRLTTLLSASIAGLLLIIPALSQAEGDQLQIHGFADVGFATHSLASSDPKGFNVGSMDLYLTPRFGSHVKALIDVLFETTPDGGLATDLERVQIGYTFNDSAALWAGRFHTPYGYWNTAYHRGAQIQTSILRPRVLDFEDKGGFLPAYMVGMWGTGKFRVGDGKLTYDVFAGNGPMMDMTPGMGKGVLTVTRSGDNDHKAMVGLNLGYEFSGMADGLRVAVHTLRGDVTDFNPPGVANIVALDIVGSSVVYMENDWEVIGEYYRFNNEHINSGATYASWADFLQVGKTFDALTPFVRVEKSELNQKDPYFLMQNSGQSYTRQALGLKYDLDPSAALKLELVNTEFAAGGNMMVMRPAYNYRSLLAQYAIRF